MIKQIKRFIFKSWGLENYLRILQRSYFLLYKTGLLKGNVNYACHYYVKNLIKKGDVVIDIGANLGYYSILFAEWTGPSGKVFSVEPIAVYNRIFNEKAKKFNNIQLCPYALGTEEKTIELVSSPQIGFLSTGLPHVYDPQRDGSIENQQFKFEAQMKIPSVLFGDLERIDYIKCDIEGFEYIVLSDMKEIIRRCRPIVQVELWENNKEDMLRMFDELRYIPHKVHENKLVSQEKGANSLPGDYIFIPENGSLDG
ncbi:MAG: FkbM family methyltransferase [Candidatus Symbiothrix sp.]|jgi:FkbM family methyltransferase|nr:FkbM family methyltransferase [Candidatus Symbiothrix sp.]